MAQPQMGRIACIQCNAWYNSEKELLEHMKTAHRYGGSEEDGPHRDDTQQDGSKIQPRGGQKPPES